MASNVICYVEWSTTNLERASRFFGGLFGWDFEPSGESYLIIDTPEGVGAGLTKTDQVSAGASPLVYIQVDDIDGCLKLAEELGGAVSQDKTAVLDIGWSALVEDPDGNLVGLYEGRTDVEGGAQ